MCVSAPYSGPSGVLILRAGWGCVWAESARMCSPPRPPPGCAPWGPAHLPRAAPLTPRALLSPPGVPDEEQLLKKPRQVVHKNTRFLRDPFSQALSRSQLQQAAALNAQVRPGAGTFLLRRPWARQHGRGWVCSPSRGLKSGPVLVRQVGQVRASPWCRGSTKGRQHGARPPGSGQRTRASEPWSGAGQRLQWSGG